MQATGVSQENAELIDGAISMATSGGTGTLVNSRVARAVIAGQSSEVPALLRAASKFIFSITAQEDELLFYSVKIGDDVIEFGGNMVKENGALIIKNFDINGASRNKLGISGVRELITDFGRQQGVKEVVVRGAPRTTGANPEKITDLTFPIE